MLDENCFAILTKNLTGAHINGVITYEQIGSAKVKDIFSDVDSKFYIGKYKLSNSSNYEFDCLIKRVYQEDKYHFVKHIRHPNVVKLVGYDRNNGSVLIRHMEGFGTFESYRKTFPRKLIDEFGAITEMFKDFIRKLLNTLRFLHGEYLAHGCLEAKHILVWTQNEELNIKLFEIGVSLFRKGDDYAIEAKHNDLRKLGNLIRTTGHQLNFSGNCFCNYLESGSNLHEINLNDVLHYPTFKDMTMDEIAIYIEKVVELDRPHKDRTVNNLSGIKWLEDFETRLRRTRSNKTTGNPYMNDSYSFVRLIRNSVKHYTDYRGTKLGLTNKFAYLEHVLQNHPNFMIGLYSAIGHLNLIGS